MLLADLQRTCTRDVSEWLLTGMVCVECRSLKIFISFFKIRSAVPCVSVCSCPSPLRADWWVTAQLPPWPASTGASMGADVSRKGSVLARKGWGLCSCWLQPFLLNEEHGHPFLDLCWRLLQSSRNSAAAERGLLE